MAFIIPLVVVASCVYTTEAAAAAAADFTTTTTCTNRRPLKASRNFISTSIDDYIEKVSSDLIQNNQSLLACIFQNTLPNTLDTTVVIIDDDVDDDEVGGGSVISKNNNNNEGSFVITGDINAMWLRDSMNQVLPYMKFANNDPNLKRMLKGLIQQQTLLILKDPYANAHSLRYNQQSPNTNDQTTYPTYGPTRTNAMIPGIYERKYELDSLCSFLKLSRVYYENTSDLEPFINNNNNSNHWIKAIKLIIDVMKDMQSSTLSSYYEREGGGGPTYQFQRQALEPTDTLLHGIGHPGLWTGMIRSSFRPSDDATTYPFLIPANAMAVVELRETIKLVSAIIKEKEKGNTNKFEEEKNEGLLLLLSNSSSLTTIIDDLSKLSNEIDQGIQQYGIGVHPILHQKMYAYEVDGYGNMYYADDANIPSLLSLPYLGYVNNNNNASSDDDPIYVNTRNFVWSHYNPWYFEGSSDNNNNINNGMKMEGIGGPHIGLGQIWPMSIMMKALTTTTNNDNNSTTEILNCLKMLIRSTANTGLIHESFDKDNIHKFTRPWFAWANSLFGTLIMKLYDDKNQRSLLLLTQQQQNILSEEDAEILNEHTQQAR